MSTLLTITSNNNAANPLTVDLSNYVVVNPGDGLDPADPAFTQRIWSRSLLKEGATLALEQLVEREMQFPLKLGPIGGVGTSPQNLSATLGLVQQINQVLQTPGATMTWQPPGASQPTTFDVLSGLVEAQYNYRAEQQSWEIANLRVFTKPLGRTASRRLYALASGVGPITYVAPSSFLATLPSPGGIVYAGNPSLAGDAPAQLIHVATGASQFNQQAFVSLYPDHNYPVMGQSQLSALGTRYNVPTAPAGCIVPLGAGLISYAPMGNGESSTFVPPVTWEGQHRLLAFLRASGYPGALWVDAMQGNITPVTAGAGYPASVYPPGPGWGLYDLGTVAIRGSDTFCGSLIQLFGQRGGAAASSALELGGIAMLPDSSTWFVQASNMQGMVVDSIRGAEYGVGPVNSVASSTDPNDPTFTFGPITQFSRGLPPQPDPKDGLPILAYCSMPAPAGSAGFAPALQPPFRVTVAGVWALERTRYVLP
jgi:hypothetical protein